MNLLQFFHARFSSKSLFVRRRSGEIVQPSSRQKSQGDVEVEKPRVNRVEPNPNYFFDGVDARSTQNIRTCLPDAQKRFLEWYHTCRQAGLNIIIICGTRTFKEQDELYAQGRTRQGKIVTNARGGYSWHNFGVAVDFVIFEGVNVGGGVGNALWNCPDMTRAGMLAESLGLEWGGHWQFKDTSHVQLKTGLTLAEMKEKYKRGVKIV